MIETYKKIGEDESHEIYQLNPLTRYWLFLSIALMFLYDLVESNVLPFIGIASLAAYIFLCFLPSRTNMSTIKTAMKQGTVELSGSIWSISNPQKVKIPKALTPDT